MLVTHLKIIAELEDEVVRKEVLQAFRRFEKQDESFPNNRSTTKTPKSSTTTVQGKEKLPFSIKDIIAVVNILLGRGLQDITDTKRLADQVVTTVISKTKEEKKESKQARKADNKDRFGSPLFCQLFPDIQNLFQNQPINEMGVVALFCTAFHLMKKVQFQWEMRRLTFSAIKFVRTGFPDACIRCVVDDKYNIELDVEFEFKSYNYIKHEHFYSPKNCDLIICWEENAKTDKKLQDYENVKKLPPVLSLKEFLQSGQIGLI